MLGINFKKLTDFEKLIHVQWYSEELQKKIKNLEFKQGVLISTIDELELKNKELKNIVKEFNEELKYTEKNTQKSNILSLQRAVRNQSKNLSRKDKEINMLRKQLNK